MIDECTDIQNKEQVNGQPCLMLCYIQILQVVVALRWVDNDLSVHEEFIGLYVVNSIESSSLFHVIKDTLLRLNLPMTKICGQCYDGASNMRGVRNGVAKLIQDEEPRGVFTHCYQVGQVFPQKRESFQ